MMTPEGMKPIDLEDVLITEELAHRSPRTPNWQAEAQALHTLARQLAEQPQTMLKTLVDVARELCSAGSAGVSLRELTADGEEVFRWVAIVGAIAAYEQGSIPCQLSPCSVAIDRHAPQLYAYPHRYFIRLQDIQPTIFEALVIPLLHTERPLGAIWIVSHDEARQFDAEDVRILTSIADFTAAALQSIQMRRTAEEALQREQAARLEAKAASQALDEAAERTVNILESITDAFVCLDSEWRITYVNQETAKLNNMQPAEMIGKTHWEVWPWSVGTVVEQTYRRVMADQVAAHFEFFSEPLRMWLEIHAYPTQTGLSIYFRNISDRKCMELALHESQTRIETMVVNIPGMVYRYVPEANGFQNFTFVSSGCRELFELEPETILADANSLWSLIHPDDVFSFLASVEYAIKNFLPWEWLGRFITPSGKIKWIQGRAGANCTTDGKAWDGVLLDFTERKQAEEALRESEEFNRSIIESSADCIKVLDLDGCLLSINSSGCRLLELDDCTPLFGRSWLEFWQGSERVEVDKAVKIALSGGTGYFSGYCPTAKGTPKWWEIVITAVLDLQGKPKRLLVNSRDVTKRKQAEAALRQSESRFRLIVESAKDYAIFSLDLNGMITSWNSGAERLLGYKETEIIGNHSRILFTPEDNEQGQAESEIQTALTQERADDERWHLRKDGSRFWANGLMMQLQDEEGNIQGFVKILRDMTESRQAAEREQFLAQASAVLAESIDYKTTLLNIARLAVPFLADFCFFDIVNTNNQIERVAWHHGNPAKQEWFENIQRYIPLHDNKNDPITNVLFTGKANLVANVTDTWMQAAATSAEHLQFIQESQVRSLMTVPLIAHQRKLGALTLGFTLDSHRHYTQTDLALAEELGHRAALALDNAKLYQQAQEANRIKDEFLAVLSHELRSPLSPILGWAKMLQTGRLDDVKTAQALATIERNARLQSELIEDLLDISRILRGKLSLNTAQVNLKTVVQSAIETVQLAATSKSIVLETILAPEIESFVMGDATRLQQIVWNILSNAIKFTPGGGRVKVQLAQIGAQAQIKISDTGIGITPDFLPHVFDYFCQAESGSNRKFGGLGLGLAIVRQLVEAHGGTVWAESLGAGMGTTFTVRLPLMPVQPTKKTGSQRLESAFNLNHRLILVVDDEPDTREFIAFVLEQAGAIVEKAASAAEALAILSKCQPDVILSDIGMPEMDGYILIEQVRALPAEQGGEIPAIALTAYAGAINQQKVLAAGFQQYLAKPFEPEALVQAIANLLKNS